MVGLGVFDGIEGAQVGAVDSVHAALEADEVVAAAREGLSQREIFLGMPDFLGFVLPELGFGDAQAALEPVVEDQRVDQGAELGGVGEEAVVVFGGEGIEGMGVFAADDLGLGVNAGFQGIEAGDGLALDGAWAGGFLSVAAVGVDLILGRHAECLLAPPG